MHIEFNWKQHPTFSVDILQFENNSLLWWRPCMALVLPSVGILIVRSVTAIGSMVNVMDEKITKITGNGYSLWN